MLFDKTLLNSYKQKQKEIKSRLDNFKSLPEKQQFQEFLFCLLTPQSNAQRCWQAVEEISKLPRFEESKITKILKTRTRFYKTKSIRVIKARENWPKVKQKIGRASCRERV